MGNSVEENIKNNLVELRKSKKLKQTDLAEKIGYSDKTISRWENGSTVPDVGSLAVLAKFYGITLDDIVKENAVEKSSEEVKKKEKDQTVNEIAMLALSVITVWLIAVITYVGLSIVKNYKFWQIWIWATPVSTFIMYRFNRRNTKIRWLNTILLSVILWSIVTAIFLIYLEYGFWQLFLVPIPIEAMIIIYTLFGKHNQKK